MEDQNKDKGTEQPEVKAPKTEQSKVEKEVPALAINQQQVDELLGLAEAVKAAGGIGALVATLKDFAANQKTERDSLIGVLAANQKLGMTAEELGLLPTPTLQRMVKSNEPTDYSLRSGGFSTNRQESDWKPYKGPEAEK